MEQHSRHRAVVLAKRGQVVHDEGLGDGFCFVAIPALFGGVGVNLGEIEERGGGDRRRGRVFQVTLRIIEDAWGEVEPGDTVFRLMVQVELGDLFSGGEEIRILRNPPRLTETVHSPGLATGPSGGVAVIETLARLAAFRCSGGFVEVNRLPSRAVGTDELPACFLRVRDSNVIQVRFVTDSLVVPPEDLEVHHRVDDRDLA